MPRSEVGVEGLIFGNFYIIVGSIEMDLREEYCYDDFVIELTDDFVIELTDDFVIESVIIEPY